MKADRAVVMSFYEHDAPGTLRVNLRWQGSHEVSDFKLDSFGEVVDYATETENSGWVTVKPRGEVHVGEEIPLLKVANR
jgi:hypothetical protein